jgi:hypothetical protein
VTLLGAWASLYDIHGRPIRVAILEVSGILVAYQVALALVVTFLHRVRREARETRVLLAILALFLLDGGLVQHFYGWAEGVGLAAAAVGSCGSIVVALLLAVGLRLPISGRLVAMFLATILFVRFGPALLVFATPGTSSAPAWVLLGWLLALLPLAAFFPPSTQKEPRLPVQALDRAGFFGCLALALLHFVNAGRSFALPFPPLALAPLLLTLAPALERLFPTISDHRAARRLVSGLPWLGVFLAATAFAPSVVDTPWANAWPLTPFFLTLVGGIAVQLFRAHRNGDPALAHQAALLAMLGTLGGDLPQILVSARFPGDVQAIALLAMAALTIAIGRRPREAAVLAALAGFVVAGWIAGKGYPWFPAFFIALAGSQVAIETTTGWVIPRGPRLAIVGALTLLPVCVFLADRQSLVGLLVAIGSNLATFFLGWRRRDSLLETLSPGSLAIGFLGWILELSVGSEGLRPSRLLVEAGFLLLAIGFLRSLYGDRLRAGWGEWWDGEALSNPPSSFHPSRRNPLTAGESAP